jgi:hypothetical protein
VWQVKQLVSKAPLHVLHEAWQLVHAWLLTNEVEGQLHLFDPSTFPFGHDRQLESNYPLHVRHD